jgi:hypothetical protein
MGDKKKDKREAKSSATAEGKRAAGRRAAPLPQTRAELLTLHRETRARRNGAEWGSPEHVEAINLLERIEIEIARVERAMDPPRV